MVIPICVTIFCLSSYKTWKLTLIYVETKHAYKRFCNNIFQTKKWTIRYKSFPNFNAQQVFQMYFSQSKIIWQFFKLCLYWNQMDFSELHIHQSMSRMYYFNDYFFKFERDWNPFLQFGFRIISIWSSWFRYRLYWNVLMRFNFSKIFN